MCDELELLRDEIWPLPSCGENITAYLRYEGMREHYDDPVPCTRAYATEALLTRSRKIVYKNDRILGSIQGKCTQFYEVTQQDMDVAMSVVMSYGERNFATNNDHYCADWPMFVQRGIPGTLEAIENSAVKHSGDESRKSMLNAMRITINSLASMAKQYADEAAKTASEANESQRKELLTAAKTCNALAERAPSTFREALQLVWLTHIAFCYEDKYAMALGRLDQYLYPFYQHDINESILTPADAQSLLECTLIKIGEMRIFNYDDVVNIAIGGLCRDGAPGVNELSYLILHAVKNCGIPGPNLSARLYDGVEEHFIDECLKVIGTGLGYPALMNDDVNIKALEKQGYPIEDCRDYCMVGCIENFIMGKQPPWSDGRYNVPKYIELALNDGRCMLTNTQLGPRTGDPESFVTMDDFLTALRRQMEFGASEYMMFYRNENDRFNRSNYVQPLLSGLCRGCIESGLDVNNGGAMYPSVHGAGCMGIGTFADCLAAIDQAVFNGDVTMEQLHKALLSNFDGFDQLRTRLLAQPKYGNNDARVDKYAVMYVEWTNELFSQYRTPDGGPIYTAIASNVQNISAGALIAATPDGRKAKEPMSDAASPMHGMDKNGPTAVVNSITKPDYSLVATGTVINQKFSPSMFSSDTKRAKLAALIRVYFEKGGQEIQINAVSRDILSDAMEKPEDYLSLVVRVSGFSAYYTTLTKEVQLDILERTEQE